MPNTTIAIWNLERPPKLSAATRKAQLDKLASIDADLWILSESASTATLANYHSRFSQFAPGYHEPTECGAAILTRWPVSQTIETFDPTFAVCAEIPESPLGPLVVYASVIPYANWKGREGTSGPWLEHRKSIAAHAADWRRIRDRFKDHHFVAGGDFNQCLDGSGWYGNPESEAMLRSALADAGLECVTAENFRTKHALSRGNIDHVCLSAGLRERVRNVTPWEGTEGVKMSDHNGVSIELS